MSRSNNGQPRPVGDSMHHALHHDLLHMKLSSLPRLLPLEQDYHRHKRERSDPSTAGTEASDASSRSRGSMESTRTEDTDVLLTPTPFRSRASTTTELWQPDQQVIAPNYVPCKPPIRVILGTASVGSKKSPLAKITTVEAIVKFTSMFRARGYNDIDTARAYPVGRGGTCEQLLGEKELRLPTWANISTKVSSFMPGSHRTKNINLSIEKSLEALGTDEVDIMYLHAPDRATPFSETCEAMHDAWLEGKFQRFGLSNYTVEQVEEIVKICEECGYNKPTVYQGQYNPICRGAEDQLFEVLRKHNIAFYAYSPSACGFFSNKVTKASVKDTDSRWNIASPLGAKYAGDYFHDPLFAAAETVRSQAKQYGISGHAAALRWTTWHSQLDAACGDAVIIGASKIEQLEENLNILEQGPLPEGLVKVMDKMWDQVKQLEKGPRFSFV
ncbi:hypothetical protein H2198_005747 [Neophaeococcomyces mojaviensis]|uniref:Uncharacterized protein n=1 Tax=Neophaeococcomyces mojaviensis TaxID=3383035 RepID=A0ACC3A566_9EURO|nr:hypothetical protein H2198_005747 [Knufia sp. JES_112]